MSQPTVMTCIGQEEHKLIVYDETIAMGDSYRAAVKCKENIQYCIAEPFGDVDEAVRIYNLLITLKHPNLLSPIGLWACRGGDFGKGEVKAFIAFVPFDGALVDLSREEIFLVEGNSSKAKSYGFLPQGSRLFCDILNVVDCINGQYENANAATSFPLRPLKVNPRRIVYKRVAEGEYHVFLWADFLKEFPSHKRKKTKRGRKVDDVRSMNWESIGTYLKNFWSRFELTPNQELTQLFTLLTNTEKSLIYSDLMWKPGLWDVDTKVHFIREVYWCIDNDSEKERKLKSISSLDLKSCITSLGFTDKESNLFNSVMFLRKKVVAHMDDLYSYRGAKDDMCRHKREIEIRVQKSRPDYMIKLVKHMQTLNWIPTSPLLRSSTTYIQPFMCGSNKVTDPRRPNG
ncbi:uncharacterized protein [Miscanthus floridulus]|uniref:uncharacterized protein isoform X2 n=1 Tax=Miscanthus floridulus TaxID=154761 RepID=UPI00345A7CA1